MDKNSFVKYHLKQVNELIDCMLKDDQMSLLEFDVLKRHLIDIYDEVVFYEKSSPFYLKLNNKIVDNSNNEKFKDTNIIETDVECKSTTEIGLEHKNSTGIDLECKDTTKTDVGHKDITEVDDGEKLLKHNDLKSQPEKILGWRDVMFDVKGTYRSSIKQSDENEEIVDEYIYSEDSSSYNVENAQTIADKAVTNNNSTTIADTIGKNENSTLGSKIIKGKLNNIKDAIDISEKFYFVKSLFNDDIQSYNETLDNFNGFTSLNDAKIYLQFLINRHSWDYNSDAYKRFEEIIERRFY